tara:strand:- start:268 stop:633 length:366 start_codon:yes stop_codon:yes gene_type:complete
LYNHLTKKLEPNQLPKSLVNTTWNIQNISSNLHFTDLQHKKIRVYLYSLSHNLIREVLSKLDLCVTLTKDVRKANVIIGLRSNLQQNQKLQKLAREKNIPIYKVTRNTVYQVVKLIQFIML